MSADLQSSFNTFKKRLLIHPQQRTPKDVELIYRHLREMQANSKLSNSTVQAMAKNARYEVHDSNELLYTSNDISYCWYILLCGSVFLDNCMYLPGSSFGKQSVLGKRGFDCLILERSEMIVIDYPNEKLFKPYQRKSYSMQDLETLLALDADEVKFKEITDDYYLPEEYEKYHDEYPIEAESRETNFRSSPRDEQHDQRNREMDINLSGLKETMVDSVDSDDDDISTASESASVRDIVRDCLEKDPSERTENDINILMEFVQHLPAFNKVTFNVRREMCAVMVFAVVEKAGTDVMIDGEEMDSWTVILNGSVEILQKGRQPITKHLGDSFGVNTTPGKVYNKGVMKTRIDDCQFVCIARDDYWQIFSQGEANTQRVEEEGEVVLVTEHRTTDGGSREGQVVIRGMPDRLLDHLMEDHSTIDPTYVEDYLLTYVIFNNKAHDLVAKLLKWFDRGQLKDKVTRVMLLWVNNHYYDFAGDRYMESCLERFELLLDAKKMLGQLRLLNMARSMKSTRRVITLNRSTKDTKMEFSIIGGSENNMGIFVSKIDFESKTEESGLRKGDQILEVNGQSFENIKLSKAWSFLKSQLHLSLVVKGNICAYKQALEAQQKAKRGGNRNDSLFKKHLFRPRAPVVARSSSDTCDRQKPQDIVPYQEYIQAHEEKDQPPKRPDSYSSGTYPGRHHGKATKDVMKKAMRSILPRSGSNQELNSDEYIPFENMQKPRAVESESNEYFVDGCQVVKVYRTLDLSFKYFIINKDTTAQEVVIAAVEQFAITDTGGQPYFLCEVTVTEDGVIKQKRLTNFATDLANRIGLSSRYFLKNALSDGGVTPEIAQEIARDGTTTFLQLSPLDVARELTLQDFDLFRSIDSREYIYNLFDSKTSAKFTNLGKFEETANTEMFWVMREICSEMNMIKRVKIIKRFIKIAKLCNDFKNYNSMFALLSGLDHSSVRRLKSTWEKVPAKYVKIFEDLKLLMDPSRNMSRYRNLFSGERAYPPLIPFFPVIKKDLTFINLGNETYVDGLVNFEKLRMIAKEVRKVCKYCAIGYDPGKMDDVSHTSNGAPPSIAQSVVSVMTGQNTVGRKNRRTNSGMANPKKLYEEALAARRMRQYLENLSNTIPEEDEIIKMSKICEPPPGSAPSSTLAIRKRQQNTSPISNKKSETPTERPKSHTPPVPKTDEQEEKLKIPPTITNSEEHRITPSPPVAPKDNRISQRPYPEFFERPNIDDLEEQVSIV